MVKDEDECVNHACYESFAELCQRIKNLKTVSNWNSKLLSDRIILKKMAERYLLPELEIIVDSSLAFTVKVFGCYLVDDHPLYLLYRRTMRNVTMSNLVKELEAYSLCVGVSITELTSKLYHHVIPVNQDSMDIDEDSNHRFPHHGYWRAKECSLICKQDNAVCDACED